ncbi:uncharacterized protein PG998_002996 [Apiospora kogelbergensis]|uniref:uncharacterized protein n=1 Tax=Apiospora kogelbergensis TaxID=1337665 RepID=UPI00312EBAB9
MCTLQLTTPPRPQNPEAKNRIATSNCRRKKDEERVLDGYRRILQAQYSILIDSTASLRAEILALKHEVLRHGNCDFQPINTHIAMVAVRVG